MSFGGTGARVENVWVEHAAVLDRLRRDVVSRQPVDDRERRSLGAFIEAYDRLDEPLSQESDVVHVTG